MYWPFQLCYTFVKIGPFKARAARRITAAKIKYTRTITGHTRNYYKTNKEITKKPQFGQHAGLEKVLDVTCTQMSRKDNT